MKKMRLESNVSPRRANIAHQLPSVVHGVVAQYLSTPDFNDFSLTCKTIRASICASTSCVLLLSVNEYGEKLGAMLAKYTYIRRLELFGVSMPVEQMTRLVELRLNSAIIPNLVSCSSLCHIVARSCRVDGASALPPTLVSLELKLVRKPGPSALQHRTWLNTFRYQPHLQQLTCSAAVLASLGDSYEFPALRLLQLNCQERFVSRVFAQLAEFKHVVDTVVLWRVNSFVESLEVVPPPMDDMYRTIRHLCMSSIWESQAIAILCALPHLMSFRCVLTLSKFGTPSCTTHVSPKTVSHLRACMIDDRRSTSEDDKNTAWSRLTFPHLEDVHLVMGSVTSGGIYTPRGLISIEWTRVFLVPTLRALTITNMCVNLWIKLGTWMPKCSHLTYANFSTGRCGGPEDAYDRRSSFVLSTTLVDVREPVDENINIDDVGAVAAATCAIASCMPVVAVLCPPAWCAIETLIHFASVRSLDLLRSSAVTPALSPLSRIAMPLLHTVYLYPRVRYVGFDGAFYVESDEWQSWITKQCGLPPHVRIRPCYPAQLTHENWRDIVHTATTHISPSVIK